MKCIHRIDGKFRIVRRTKQCHMTSLQELRNRRNRLAAAWRAVLTVARTNHHATFRIFLPNDGAIPRIAEINIQCSIEFEASTRSFVNKGTIRHALLQYRSKIRLYRFVQVTQKSQ